MTGIRLYKGDTPGVYAPVIVAAEVFFAGLVSLASYISLPDPAETSAENAGPLSLVLLDGYPAADGLIEHGTAVWPLISELRERERERERVKENE